MLTPAQRNFELREPQAEYRALQKIWEQELTEYGWADQATGAVRIPIDEAMRRYAATQAQKAQPQQGLQQQGAPSQQPGQQIPSPASSGRAPEQRNQ